MRLCRYVPSHESRRISIHAPVKGATSRRRQIYSKVRISPRTREGCDPSCFGGSCRITGISIHAPVKGATCHQRCEKQRPAISIHAPVKGATKGPYANTIIALDFNPRTREGCDFDFLLIEINFGLISIHAPVKGATCFSWSPDGRRLYFNPRTREGCD